MLNRILNIIYNNVVALIIVLISLMVMGLAIVGLHNDWVSWEVVISSIGIGIFQGIVSGLLLSR